MPRIALLPGDGIGPELAEAAYRVLQAFGDFEIAEHALSLYAHCTKDHCPNRPSVRPTGFRLPDEPHSPD